MKKNHFRATKDEGMLFVNKDDPLLACFKPEIKKAHPSLQHAHQSHSTLDVSRIRGFSGFDISLKLGKETVRFTSTPSSDVITSWPLRPWPISQGGGRQDRRGRGRASDPYAGVEIGNNVRCRRGAAPVIDDTSNANPASMEKAVATLVSLPCKGKKIAISGNMKELGRQNSLLHRELGRLFAKTDISLPILLLGDQIRVVRGK